MAGLIDDALYKRFAARKPELEACLLFLDTPSFR